MYRSRSHSYRELPLRIAELGPMYRAELSGVLGGLTRVRAIQLNDAHISAPSTRPSRRPAPPWS
ncbi:aminoacyl--tRNA ligase-related protein [Streptomyces sp. NPDC048362]|uniref:aminoacyl--tRNA ligase-related protein n=1 Tax=Streptomyces sp. NPDC048362 TaxID=3365539 RepID=UPI003714D8C2